MSYTPLPTHDPALDEDKNEFAHFKFSKSKFMHQNFRSLLRYPLLWVTLTLTIIASLLYYLQTKSALPSLPFRRNVYMCGDNPSEALANGCQFDMTSFSWLPPTCADTELMEQFLSRRNWTWYSDDNDDDHQQMTPISQDEVSSGRHEILHVSWEYHFHHCTYMWRKLHRAVLKGKPVDGYIGSMHHTAHCADILLQQDEMRAGGETTVIFAKYPSCGEGVEVLRDESHHGWYRVEDGIRVSSAPALPAGAHHHR